MKTAAVAVLTLLAISAPIYAQSVANHPGEYGYQFVPADTNSGYGGQLWFTQPQFPTSANPNPNLYDGINFYFDAIDSFILTPEQNFNVETGLDYSPVSPTLPQIPFPYTGQLSMPRYLAQYDGSGFGQYITWNQSGIAFMNSLSGGGYVEFLGIENFGDGQHATLFVDTNIYGVFEQYTWTVTPTNISWQTGFSPWTYEQVISDPDFSGSENGTWVPLIPQLSPSNTIGFTNGAFGFNLSGPPGLTVIIQASSDLKTWSSLQTNILGNVPLSFSDPQSSTNSSRFYRAIAP